MLQIHDYLRSEWSTISTANCNFLHRKYKESYVAIELKIGR